MADSPGDGTPCRPVRAGRRRRRRLRPRRPAARASRFADRGCSVADLRRQRGGGRRWSTTASCRSTSRAPQPMLAGGVSPPGCCARPPTRRRRQAENVVVVIGTPVDEHLNPDPQAVPRALERLRDHFRDGQLLVLRSTVLPGRHRGWSSRWSRDRGLRHRRRVLPRAHRRGQGDERALRAAADRLGRARPRAASGPRRCSAGSPTQIVELEPEEAELAKLFTNTWRYIKFAAANQFYMIANDFGLDFERIRPALAAGLPARRRHARRRVRRRAVPVQGHDAARRVQQQQLRARPRGDARSTRACRCTSSPGSSSATTCST